jgi:hypothetical protein
VEKGEEKKRIVNTASFDIRRKIFVRKISGAYIDGKILTIV